MLETKFKVVFLFVVLACAAMPIVAILRGTTLTPFEEPIGSTDVAQPEQDSAAKEAPVQEEMVTIPEGPFVRGTESGGFDEQPPRTIYLDAFSIDRYEVTNHQYQQFVLATGHRKPGLPARYAKSGGKVKGTNQPVVYVSWDDATEYCRWKGTRLPTEAEWEKAMRGSDGRLWPWGNKEQANGANWARVQDGYEVSAPVGSFQADKSAYGVMDGAGNVIEWVADWYDETYYKSSPEQNPPSPEYGTYRVLRGGGYTTTGGDVRITSRSKMMPDFRDETIGFRCAISKTGMKEEGEKKSDEFTGNQSSRESKTRPK
ncbi:MAG TPA: SUMF1/EgtB/PvdO family nonheme iron enzyme [Nitrospira sp.]|nr:SUMF1/EgtB/PvdO family nonheme iron enzyme [Nitrospira sp.]